MKIIQITDPHLLIPGKSLFGLDTLERLRKCVAHINQHHADAEFAILTGDITHHDDEEAYQAAYNALKFLSMPWYALPGNHDSRTTFPEIFTVSQQKDGFIQNAFDTEQGRFILLDTLDQGKSSGILCSGRLEWLRQQLLTNPSDKAYIFMHHPPFPISVPVLDRSGLSNADIFYDLILPFGSVRHIFAGHVHLPVSGHWHGIGFTTLLGTHQQSPVTFACNRFIADVEPPPYGIIFIHDQGVIIHSHDYMEKSLFDEYS